MGRDIKTERGIIYISKEVIATLAGLAATECFGIVGMVSSRIFSDGISEL
ncbi:MAG: Asp23/Gls24 family envelope stress response protein, partial [Clostridiales bacterium]